MRTLTKEMLDKLTPDAALDILKKGNQRFVNNLSNDRNLLKQVNETSEGQHPFAVIISCIDSRTSAELIFDQGLGDILSVRIAGNVINEDILGSTELGCKLIGTKIVLVLGHTGCGAISAAINDLDLGHVHFITSKIKRCIPRIKKAGQLTPDEFTKTVTKENVLQSINDVKHNSSILSEMAHKGEIKIVGGVYDVTTGVVDFLDI
ncbi:MAG: carbonic anhydrase [Bacteriovoracaceae bacterium]